MFCVCGDVVEIFLVFCDEYCIRVEFFGDEIEWIREVDVLIGEIFGDCDYVVIFLVFYFVIWVEKMEKVILNIEQEFEECLKVMCENGKFLEVQCFEQCMRYDFEMMWEMGFCLGIENYLRYLMFCFLGFMLYMLFDYFLDDFMIVVDELYVMILQVCGMFNGDQVRKQVFVDYGFCLLLVFDNCLF